MTSSEPTPQSRFDKELSKQVHTLAGDVSTLGVLVDQILKRLDRLELEQNHHHKTYSSMD